MKSIPWGSRGYNASGKERILLTRPPGIDNMDLQAAAKQNEIQPGGAMRKGYT